MEAKRGLSSAARGKEDNSFASVSEINKAGPSGRPKTAAPFQRGNDWGGNDNDNLEDLDDGLITSGNTS